MFVVRRLRRRGGAISSDQSHFSCGRELVLARRSFEFRSMLPQHHRDGPIRSSKYDRS